MVQSLVGSFLAASAVAVAGAESFFGGGPGCRYGNCVDGYGKFVFGDKGFYEGAFVKGVSHGLGQLHHGKDGSTYAGAFDAGKREGRGVYTFSNGDVYEGEYANGTMFGYGVLTRKAGGDVFEGECAVNAPWGVGVLRFADGVTYEGEIAAGKPSGDGRYYKDETFEYAGQFADGKPKGYGAGFISYVDKTEGATRRDLEGLFDGLELVDDDEEAGVAAAAVGKSAAILAVAASGLAVEAAIAARDGAKTVRKRARAFAKDAGADGLEKVRADAAAAGIEL